MNDFTKKELKRCPFCGTVPEFEYGTGNKKLRDSIIPFVQWQISCKACSFSRCFRAQRLTSDEIKEIAINWWNGRFAHE